MNITIQKPSFYAVNQESLNSHNSPFQQLLKGPIKKPTKLKNQITSNAVQCNKRIKKTTRIFFFSSSSPLFQELCMLIRYNQSTSPVHQVVATYSPKNLSPFISLFTSVKTEFNPHEIPLAHRWAQF